MIKKLLRPRFLLMLSIILCVFNTFTLLSQNGQQDSETELRLLLGGKDISINKVFTLKSVFSQIRDVKKCQNIDACLGEKMRETSDCQVYWKEVKYKYNTKLNIFKSDISGTRHDVITIMVQLTVDRLDALKFLAEQWSGPISAAIYVNPLQMVEKEKVLKDWMDSTKRNNIALTLVERKGVSYIP